MSRLLSFSESLNLNLVNYINSFAGDVFDINSLHEFLPFYFERQERLRMKRLEREVEEIQNTQKMCRRLKRRMRRSTSEMRQLFRSLKRKFTIRTNQLRRMQYRRQRRINAQQRLEHAWQMQRRNVQFINFQPETDDADFVEVKNEPLLDEDDESLVDQSYLNLDVAGTIDADPLNWQAGDNIEESIEFEAQQLIKMENVPEAYIINMNNESEANDGYAGDGFAEEGYAGDGFAEEGYASDGYAEDGFAEEGYVSDDIAEDGFAEEGYIGEGYAEGGFANEE